MSLEGQGGRLAALTSDLVRHWERTRPCWRDARGEMFEKRTLDPIRNGVSATVGAMQELDELMRTIRRDCE